MEIDFISAKDAKELTDRFRQDHSLAPKYNLMRGICEGLGYTWIKLTPAQVEELTNLGYELKLEGDNIYLINWL